jgi:hypothetical protein
MEHNRKVLYPGLADKIDFFPNIKKISIKNRILGDRLNKTSDNLLYKFFRRFFHHKSKPLRFLEYVSMRPFHMRLDPLQEFFYPEFDAGQKMPDGLCFFEGWAFRMHEAFRKHSQIIRSFFQFDNATQETAQHFLKNFHGGLTVGIHVRRGDYSLAAPQWVHPDGYWIEAITRIQSTTDKKINFIIVSDDNALKFDIDRVHRFYGSDILDMALLSKCDFVMGPPSTFNRWAAFFGNKPHFCAWNAQEFPTMSHFKKFKMTSANSICLNTNDIDVSRWFGII